MKPLHVQLREMREAAGLSQVALAARIGMTSGTISRAEGEHSVPPLPTIEAWSAACGFTLSLAFFSEAHGAIDPNLPAADAKIIDAWRNLDDESRAIVGALIAKLRSTP